ncbi:MAG: hypothetical protein KDK55_04330, partial [Chlamydiia bacterium]|nr:hypothetical protein [Chlamydiia bacterium]
KAFLATGRRRERHAFCCVSNPKLRLLWIQVHGIKSAVAKWGLAKNQFLKWNGYKAFGHAL